MLTGLKYTKVILVQGFCQLKVEIARFSILFHLQFLYPILKQIKPAVALHPYQYRIEIFLSTYVLVEIQYSPWLLKPAQIRCKY